MHEHYITDDNGNTVDVITFCSDSCHTDWHAGNGTEYEGWNGAHESADYNSYCAQCGVIAGTGPEACSHQKDNFVVNRFTSDDGETCDHGNWIQLPKRLL